MDFEIIEGGRGVIAAQVKGGVAGSPFSPGDAVRILVGLLRNDSDRYLVITNRKASAGVRALRELLVQHAVGGEPADRIRDGIYRLLDRSERVRQLLSAVDDTWWERLRRASIVVDTRESDEVDECVRELVRTARRHADPSSVGWDAADLVSKYLVAVTLDIATGEHDHHLSGDDLASHLRVNPEVARSVLRAKEWRFIFCRRRAAPMLPGGRFWTRSGRFWRHR
ncbi:hypothetical protein AB0B25_24215 [Nocardia sp. NPDC049190]|uniref:hypothetical protein n=1 Tax=Nocardia sp. NPDC049190 TaxID=3155650 RepID=UPI0033DDA0CC